MLKRNLSGYISAWPIDWWWTVASQLLDGQHCLVAVSRVAQPGWNGFQIVDCGPAEHVLPLTDLPLQFCRMLLAVREAYKTESTSVILGVRIETTQSCISPQGTISKCIPFTDAFKLAMEEFHLIDLLLPTQILTLGNKPPLVVAIHYVQWFLHSTSCIFKRVNVDNAYRKLMPRCKSCGCWGEWCREGERERE